MRITTTVVLESGDSFLYTADAAAAQIIAALGGNPTNDYATVNIQTNQTGQSGTDTSVQPGPP